MNTGRTTSHTFYINNTPMKKCRNYVYLEVTFSISGSLTEAKNNLYHKGIKALFKVKNVFKDTPQRLKPYYIYLTIQLSPYFFIVLKFRALFQHNNY